MTREEVLGRHRTDGFVGIMIGWYINVFVSLYVVLLLLGLAGVLWVGIYLWPFAPVMLLVLVVGAVFWMKTEWGFRRAEQLYLKEETGWKPSIFYFLLCGYPVLGVPFFLLYRKRRNAALLAAEGREDLMTGLERRIAPDVRDVSDDEVEMEVGVGGRGRLTQGEEGNVCWRCGFDDAPQDICPECGSAVDGDRLHLVSTWAASVLILFLALGTYDTYVVDGTAVIRYLPTVMLSILGVTLLPPVIRRFRRRIYPVTRVGVVAYVFVVLFILVQLAVAAVENT